MLTSTLGLCRVCGGGGWDGGIEDGNLVEVTLALLPQICSLSEDRHLKEGSIKLEKEESLRFVGSSTEPTTASLAGCVLHYFVVDNP